MERRKVEKKTIKRVRQKTKTKISIKIEILGIKCRIEFVVECIKRMHFACKCQKMF